MRWRIVCRHLPPFGIRHTVLEIMSGAGSGGAGPSAIFAARGILRPEARVLRASSISVAGCFSLMISYSTG